MVVKMSPRIFSAHISSGVHVCRRSFIGFISRPSQKSRSATVTHQQSQTIPFTPEQICDVILDVDAYPLFLPHCHSVNVIERGAGEVPKYRRQHTQCQQLTTSRMIHPNESKKQQGYIVANVDVGLSIFQVKYCSYVSYIRPHHICIEAGQTSLFESLLSNWRMTLLSNHSGTKVDFNINLEVQNPLAAHALQSVISQISGQQFDAFINRIRMKYGTLKR